MLFERIVGNVERGYVPPEPADVLDVEWHDLARRAIRRASRSGRRVGVLLPRGVFARHGDVLHGDAGYLQINLLPADVLIAIPADANEMGLIALTLGNMHVPAQVSGGELVVAADAPAEALFRREKVAFATDRRRFEPSRLAPEADVALAEGFELQRPSNQ